MSNLPVIVGIGGINSAGRSSGFHSYKRMVCDKLAETVLLSTWQDLAKRMGISNSEKLSFADIEAIKAGTLLRKIESFDPNNVLQQNIAKLVTNSIIMKKSKLPEHIPAGWQIEELANNEVKVTVPADTEILLPSNGPLAVTSGGNIPSGFDPGKLYNSHHHPRGLKLAIYGASDALNSLGIEWSEILQHINPDEVAVYAGSAISQVDENSLGGLFTNPLTGKRASSKMMALSFPQMTADFINSYVINSVGTTGSNVGACATFLYNLKQGTQDIQTKKAKVVIVGAAEAPIIPEIIEGFRAMGALATDEALCALDNSTTANNRRACRPFSNSVGFCIAESAQFVILMNDELAIKLGANIYGSVADVFINADGNKKSIAAPGAGNYLTFTKATALAKAILQEDIHKTYVQAHGTGTPQNRTSESHILNETAKAFGINNWPVTSTKSYVGHSIGTAAGDQLTAALGVWQHGWIPGIKSIDHIADDVHRSNLNILLDHQYVGEKGRDIKGVIINSKGFGGNNATALVLSPEKTLAMLNKRYGTNSMQNYYKKNIAVQQTSATADLAACQGAERITYKFGEAVMEVEGSAITQSTLTLSEFINKVELPTNNIYPEYT